MMLICQYFGPLLLLERKTALYIGLRDRMVEYGTGFVGFKIFYFLLYFSKDTVMLAFLCRDQDPFVHPAFQWVQRFYSVPKHP